MHWAEEIANKIIKIKPNKEEYICAAGISPSGSVHIGNFRDVATSYFVVLALKKLGKKAKLVFSWDDFDRFRKVPANVKKIDASFEDMIGMPYADIKKPFNNIDNVNTYAEYFEAEFEAAMLKFGIKMDYRYQADMYRAGKYTEYVLEALIKRKEIFDVLDRHKSQESTPEQRENYYPVSIYCSECGKDTTKITSFDEETMVAGYACACSNESDFNFNTDFNCKLSWKVDWPMRWMYEKVDFEPGGKDHASPHGSYDTSKDISREIFNIEPPMFLGYEFIGIRGSTGKMAGSSGLNLTPDFLLKLYQPEVILWLYSKTVPNKAFDFCLDDGILRQYFEFDKMLEKYRNGTANEYESDIIDYALIEGRDIELVPMGYIVQFGSIVNFDVELLEIIFDKIGANYKYEQFRDRLTRARDWLEICAPDSVNRIRTTRNWDYFTTIDEDTKSLIKVLFEYISKEEYTLEKLNKKLYDIPREFYNLDDSDKKILRKKQGSFFKAVYNLIISKDRGPRLYLFLFGINKDDYMHLLDFSYPQTKEEKEYEIKLAEEEKVAEEVEYGEPDPVNEVKEQITIDQFDTVDIRVCKVIKCVPIRKSRNCYKIVVEDGNKTRTVVSSISEYYKPEDLINKKILVVVNLKSVKITGVMSEGMLLASTNSASGCKVVFVDDAVPSGTQIH